MIINRHTGKSFNHIFCLIILIYYCWHTTVNANDYPQYISYISENDIYSPKSQDRHYTNGIRIGFGINLKSDVWEVVKNIFNKNSELTYRQEAAFGHNIYTPENYISKDLQNNDRPYAGWLYSEISTIVNTKDYEESLSISLELVGPGALGEQIQKLNHSIIVDPKPLGWGNQLSKVLIILALQSLAYNTNY